MDLEEAYSTLGVTRDATNEHVVRKFRELSRVIHPDRGGDGQEMARLIEARDTLIEHLAPSSELVPVNAVVAIVEKTMERSSLAERVDRQIGEAKIEIRELSTSRLRRRRMLAGVFAAIAAAAMFLGSEVPDAIFSLQAGAQELVNLPQEQRDQERARIDAHKQQMKAMWSVGCFGVAIYGGIFAWFLSRRVERAEALVKDLEENISNKSTCFATLKKLLEHNIERDWTLIDLVSAIDDKHYELGHWGSLVHEVGSFKLASLITNTAVQLGLIKVREEFVDGEFSQRYSISVG